MEFLEYKALKEQGLIKLDGTKATIDRSEVTTIDKEKLIAEIQRHKAELKILTELFADLP